MSICLVAQVSIVNVELMGNNALTAKTEHAADVFQGVFSVTMG
jgi:hypothetical protein